MQVINSIIRELDEKLEVEDLYRAAVEDATLCNTTSTAEAVSEDATIRIGPEHLVGVAIVLMGPMILATIAGLVVERVLGEDAALDTRPLNVEMQTVARLARGSAFEMKKVATAARASKVLLGLAAG